VFSSKKKKKVRDWAEVQLVSNFSCSSNPPNNFFNVAHSLFLSNLNIGPDESPTGFMPLLLPIFVCLNKNCENERQNRLTSKKFTFPQPHFLDIDQKQVKLSNFLDTLKGQI
jgi:hypothetical protein